MAQPKRTAADPAALALAAAGIALRLCPWRAVFRDGGPFFVDPDDYYHLRRMMTAAANFPRLPSFDAYLGFPSGFHCNWPPLYDWFCGLFMIGAPLKTAQTIAAFVPVLAGALTLWLFWRVASRLLERRAALCALAVAAVLPMPAFYTMLGRPDHHCVENLFFLAALLPVLDALARQERGPGLGRTLRAAAALAAGLLCWAGSAVFAAILALFAFVEALPLKKFSPVHFWIGGLLLLEAVFVAPFCGLSFWGRNGAVDFDAPSLFQPIFLAALGAWVMTAVAYRVVDRRLPNPLLPAGIAGAATLALAWRAPSSFALFAGAPLPAFRAATEMQPLLRPFGNWSLAYSNAFLGLAFWLLVPLAWSFYRDSRSAGRRLVLIWLAVTGALALLQTRYAYHLSYPGALLFGFGFERVWSAVHKKVKTGAAAWSVAAISAVLLLWPALKNSAGLVMSDADSLVVDRDLVEVCDWIRARTPATAGLWGDGKPEYGVYALHDFGGPIAALGQRPAAAANMHVMREQILESSALSFMTDAAQAADFLRSRRFRFVVLGDIVHSNELEMEARAVGIRGIMDRLWDLVYMRLYVYDGSFSGTKERPIVPVPGFRLVHESPTETFGVRRFKVFELVSGAKLEGRCSGPVTAVSAQRSDAGREFLYRDFAPCSGGRFRMKVPYPGEYTLGDAGRRWKVSVSPNEVEYGLKKPPTFD